MLVDDKWLSKWQPVETVNNQDGFVRPRPGGLVVGLSRWRCSSPAGRASVRPRPGGSVVVQELVALIGLNDEEVLVGVSLAQRAQR
jgi:hypothetical protein